MTDCGSRSAACWRPIRSRRTRSAPCRTCTSASSIPSTRSPSWRRRQAGSGSARAVLNLPWYSPALLSRRLATIDVLSSGRLRFGAGQGWSQDEYIAAGIPWEKRSKRFEEALQVLTAIWTTDPVEFEGEFFTVPRSFIGPKPVQKPRPPIYLGAFSPSAAARAARYADGWLAVAYPLADIAGMFSTVQAAAEAAGRDPGELELIVRANVQLAEQPLGDERMAFTDPPNRSRRISPQPTTSAHPS